MVKKVENTPEVVIKGAAEYNATDDKYDHRVKLTNPEEIDGNGGATAPVITNKSVATANTEESITLSSGVKKILLRVRGGARLQVAFASSESATKFITIPPGATYCESGLSLTGITLYFQTNLDSQTVELLEWT